MVILRSFKISTSVKNTSYSILSNMSKMASLALHIFIPLLGHSNTVTCCKFDCSGTHLCTCSMDRTAFVWDIRMWKHLLKLRYIHVYTKYFMFTIKHVQSVTRCKYITIS